MKGDGKLSIRAQSSIKFLARFRYASVVNEAGRNDPHLLRMYS